MPSKDPLKRFEDIYENIVRIEQQLIDITYETYLAEYDIQDATERRLERISEAARAIDNIAIELCPEQPWEEIKALGNVFRHEYDMVIPHEVWDTVKDDLPSLKVDCRRAIEFLRERKRNEEKDIRRKTEMWNDRDDGRGR